MRQSSPAGKGKGARDPKPARNRPSQASPARPGSQGQGQGALATLPPPGGQAASAEHGAAATMNGFGQVALMATVPSGVSAGDSVRVLAPDGSGRHLLATVPAAHWATGRSYYAAYYYMIVGLLSKRCV